MYSLTKDKLELVVLERGEMQMTCVALRPRESGVGLGSPCTSPSNAS